MNPDLTAKLANRNDKMSKGAKKVHDCFVKNTRIPGRTKNLQAAIIAFFENTQYYKDYDENQLKVYYRQDVPNVEALKSWEDDPEKLAEAIIAYTINQQEMI